MVAVESDRKLIRRDVEGLPLPGKEPLEGVGRLNDRSRTRRRKLLLEPRLMEVIELDDYQARRCTRSQANIGVRISKPRHDFSLCVPYPVLPA